MKKKRTPSKKVRIETTTSPSNKHAYLILALALACALILHAQNINDGFLIDDAALIQGSLMFFPGQVNELVRPDMDTYWRPAFKLVFAPMANILHFNPVGYHVFALLLHLLAIWLVFSIGRRFLPPAFAAGASCLFALHPIHVGTVAWISAGYDLLATVLVLACCLFYLRSLVSLGRVDRIAALLFMALAFLTKEVAFIAPFLILILAVFFGPSSTWNNLVGRIKGVLLFFLVGVVLIGLRIAVMGTIGGPGGHTGSPEVLRPDWSAVLANYIQVFPTAFHTPINRAALGSIFTICKPALTVLGWLLLVGLIWFRKKRETWVGFLFALTACMPISFFAFIGPNLESGYMLYLALAGFALFVAAIAFHAHERGKVVGRGILFGIALWSVLLLPLAWVHAQAHSQAGAMGDEMRQGIAKSLGDEKEFGPVYCEGFVGHYQGVRLFYDEIDQLLWPVIGPTKPGTLLLVNENLLHRNPNLPAFRDAAKAPGFYHLIWDNGQVIDGTAEAMQKLAVSEQADTEERMFLKVVDSSSQKWHLSQPIIEIEVSDVVPASSITRLCLGMKLSIPESESKEPAAYSLTWTHEGGAFTTHLPYAPSADGFTCGMLDKDPRWALAEILSEIFISPLALDGKIQISQAEILYRTKKIEIFEELILPPDHPLLQMLNE